MCIFAGTLYGQTQVASAETLRRSFAQPPSAAKLRCYWWWLNGNTTEATITRDLTEMSRKGIGGVLLVDANGSNQGGHDNVPPGPAFGSPAWVRLYLHARKTAAALHLEVTLNITSGGNLGGPDVTPAQASKVLTRSTGLWTRTASTERYPCLPSRMVSTARSRFWHTHWLMERQCPASLAQAVPQSPRCLTK
jgi:hypothetical protein